MFVSFIGSNAQKLNTNWENVAEFMMLLDDRSSPIWINYEEKQAGFLNPFVGSFHAWKIDFIAAIPCIFRSAHLSVTWATIGRNCSYRSKPIRCVKHKHIMSIRKIIPILKCMTKFEKLPNGLTEIIVFVNAKLKWENNPINILKMKMQESTRAKNAINIEFKNRKNVL